MDLSTLLNIDRYMLLSLNGSDSLFWDGCSLIYTSIAIWMPLLFVLLCVLLRNNNIKNFLLILLLIAVATTLTHVISAAICKPFFERWRPTNDPMLMFAVDTVNGLRETKYGFISSHAANSFGIATFLMLLIRNKAWTNSLIIWATINAFTRIYLGVHYPGDILCGALVGVIVGYSIYRLYVYIQNKNRRTSRRDWISNNYTKGGYLVTDIYFLLVVMYLTFIAIPIISFFTFQY